ncbi:acyl-CoA thioesterase [Desulfosporosinus sp. PR]|uniref:acyl-CoA thioesterase n=1 Tax=Candidatus Desulfosporosinus nitrosoreducens TaxID=3401928 RepID=UPI0027F0065D|nr:acyl-CoA thioesterase [Desulfosporosinus sp. PR]MDQ7097137.1 acyl-CoA thioesterase [Desulfosporosinus sp. PR]
MAGKSVDHSQVIMSNVMLPQHANPAGNVHGGEIMKLMDSAAGVVARRHARTNVVTARVDRLEFHHPIHVGDVVTCYGKLTFVGRSSMEISVTVTVEDVTKDEPAKTALTSYFTFVAIDEKGKSQPVPSLELANEEERRLFQEGRQRYLAYKQLSKKESEHISEHVNVSKF